MGRQAKKVMVGMVVLIMLVNAAKVKARWRNIPLNIPPIQYIPQNISPFDVSPNISPNIYVYIYNYTEYITLYHSIYHAIIELLPITLFTTHYTPQYITPNIPHTSLAPTPSTHPIPSRQEHYDVMSAAPTSAKRPTRAITAWKHAALRARLIYDSPASFSRK